MWGVNLIWTSPFGALEGYQLWSNENRYVVSPAAPSVCLNGNALVEENQKQIRTINSSTTIKCRSTFATHSFHFAQQLPAPTLVRLQLGTAGTWGTKLLLRKCVVRVLGKHYYYYLKARAQFLDCKFYIESLRWQILGDFLGELTWGCVFTHNSPTIYDCGSPLSCDNCDGVVAYYFNMTMTCLLNNILNR